MSLQLLKLCPRPRLSSCQKKSFLKEIKGCYQFHWKRSLFISVYRLTRRETNSMVRVLNVAEKNDAAKSIAAVLSRGQTSMREGFSRFNKIYEFEYRLMNQQVKMSMTSVSGHLLGVEFCGIFKKWHSCNPVDLFTIPVEKYCSDNYKDIKKTLEREIRGCQSLIIWTDCDREGENIGFEIIQVCQAVKPNIKVYRATFSEITPQAVTNAINNLGPPDHRVNEAVDVRQELDLRIGAAFTRFQTLRLQRIFPQALNEQLISYGSCQFPTLGFVVERYKQVQRFVSEPFWKIKVTHNHEDGISADFNWKRVRLFNQAICQALYDQCVENPVAVVTDVKSKNKSKWRPPALDTVELEKLASRKLKINAKEAMQIAEKLYTKGFISYPRTETNIFPKDLDMTSLLQEQTQSNEWGDFARGILERGPNPRNGTKTDQAHPPIHPLKFTNTLQGNDWKLYEFIVRHFLACLSSDALGHETTVEINLGEEIFTTSGLMIIARNYLDVYPYEKWNAKEIPLYAVGNTFQPDKLEMVDGETSPPPLLTEADLIALMDKYGIGTDATHADHIETVKSRMYIGLQGDGRFVPGQLGMGLVEGYDSMGFEMSKPHLRAELEADLKLICEGRKSKDEVLQTQIAKYKDVFIKATQQARKLDEALAPYLGQAETIADDQDPATQTLPSIVMSCSKCDKPMVLRTTKDSKKFYVGCSSYPECKASHWFPDSVLDVKATEQTCQICNPRQVMKLHFKFKPGRVPPSIPTDFVGCIGGCDEMLNETLGIRYFARPSQGNTTFIPYSEVTPATSRNSSQPNHSSNNNRSIGRGQGNSTRGTNRNPGRTGSGSTPNNSYHTWTSSNSSSTSFASPPLSASSQSQNRIPSSNDDSGFHSGRTTSFTQAGSSGTNNVGRSQTSISSFFGCQSLSGNGNSNNLNTSRKGQGQKMNANRNNRKEVVSGNKTVTSSNSSNRSVGADSSSGEDKTIVCNCGKDAILLTVRKEGPNTGRQFYKCFSQGDDKCNFFLWVDENDQGQGNQTLSTSTFPRVPNDRGSHSSTSHIRPASSSNSFTDQLDIDEVLCSCGLTAKSLTVMKNGPNVGRPFYGCSKPRDQSCNFFKWGDEETKVPTPQTWQARNETSNSGNKKRPSNVNTDQPKKRNPPTCSLCGMPGHKRPKCPRNPT